jgi:GTP diphosphokinase / guanosine-3',5'-bis(diphosphate) 3'-diphosphatase
MVRLTDILDKVKGYHPKADTDLINKAYVYAARMHDGQLRKSGDPYFVHPVSVANIIADLRLDASSVCAALLHDVVEDCNVSNDEITKIFGTEVAFLVDGVTKLGQVNFASKEDRQAESFRKMLVAMARDIRVLLVKLADRLDNMRTMQHMSTAAQERISRETLEIYAPLAGRLGIHWLKAELEDLSFHYISPEVANELGEKVAEATRQTDKDIAEICKRLRKMLLSRGFAAEVSGRRKHLYSIYRKMKVTGCEFEQIPDLVAFRCIMENVSDCYAALGVIHSEWTPIPGRFKDYIALPKPNMYQSLHTTVIGPGNRRIEVQIRTHEMHRTAENGIAAHWQYKERTGGIDAKDAARFAWLRQLMEFQKEVRDPEEFYESVKVDLFPEEVYVFTPAGDVKTFPRGATPIDFAYAVHSEVGNHCHGARVNGVIVPLRHKLRNGDVVEILTKNDQQPNKDWLDFVVTGRARSRIRSFLRSKERQRSIKLGRDLFEREMRKRDFSYARYLKSSELQKTLEHFHVQSADELFAQVGYGKLGLPQVMEVVSPPDVQAAESLRPSFIERTVRKVTRQKDVDGVQIEGMDGILVRFAKCCNPVAGDAVTGWITRGRGVTVHRRGCPRAMELDPERRVEVSWAPNSKMDLPVSLRVTTNDRPGILSMVTAVFTDNGLNITEATCRSQEEGRAVNVFLCTVDDLDKLRTVMRGIAKLNGVLDVERA